MEPHCTRTSYELGADISSCFVKNDKLFFLVSTIKVKIKHSCYFELSLSPAVSSLIL